MRKLSLLLLSFAISAACLAQTPQIVIMTPNGLPVAPLVVIAPNGGQFHTAEPFTLTSAVGGTIGYTLNGTPPSFTNMTTCSSPCALTAATGLEVCAFVAVASGYASGPADCATFDIQTSPTAAPTYTPSPSTSPNQFTSVAVGFPTASSTGYCTTNGNTPSILSPVYSGPFSFGSPGVANDTLLQCVAQAPGFSLSPVSGGHFVYSPPAATPVISPLGPGPFTGSVSVTMTDSCAGSTIYQAINANPTTGSQTYAGPISVTTSEQVCGMATCPLYAQSPVVCQSYTITPVVTQAPTPTFFPAAGDTVTSPTTIPVVITGLSGSTIYYCTAVSPATCIATTASTSCTSPCGPTLSTVANYNVQAVQTVPGYTTSAPGSAAYSIISGAPAGSCAGSSGTSGGLQVILTPSPRTTGTSPLLIFYNATGTTSSVIGANTTTYQDVTYQWNFGDSGSSGTGAWAYGSNPGKNSKNTATGADAAHLYITSGADKTYTATVTATDGTNTVTCTAPPVTAYDPTDPTPNGFGGTNTTCVSAAALPVAGVGGCPVGARVLQAPLAGGEATALKAPYFATNMQVLFHCTEGPWTGNPGVPMAVMTHAQIGSYGGCSGTSTSRPIMGAGFSINMNSGDVRVLDMDFENTSTANAVISTNNYNFIPYQITLYNVNSSGNNASYYFPEEAQLGLIQTTSTSMGTQQGTFINFAGNNASQWGTNSLFNNLQYLAIIGGNYDGTGTTNGSAGIETVRISQGQDEVIENNRFANANNVGATLKVHAANSKSDNPTFTGMYNEYVMNTDNLFTGTSGAQLVEYTPQNPVTDERLRYIVNERNIYAPTVAGRTGLALSAVNATARDNACYKTTQNCIQVASRGIEPTPAYDEVYNNSCSSGGTCVVLAAVDWASAGNPGGNSWIENNLQYVSGGGTTVTNAGSGNTVSNNTTNGNTGNNPAFVNGSGSLLLMPDWIPTANYSGGTTVPVFYDALGIAWPPGWDLGAVSHQGTSSGTTILTMPSYPNLYGNTYISGANGSISPTRGQTQIAPKNLPQGAVYPLSENANPYTGSGNDTYYWPNTWTGAGAATGFSPANAAGHSQLSIQPQGDSPTSTFQMEGAQFGAYMLGSDISTSNNRPQFTLQENFYNPISGPGSGPPLFTGSSTVMYESMNLAAPTFVAPASGATNSTSPYIHIELGLVPNPVPTPRSWELDISVAILDGAAQGTAVRSFFIKQGPPDGYVIVLPFGTANGKYMTFISGSHQAASWTAPIAFSWSINYAQMTAIIAYMVAQGFTAFNGLIPENFTLSQTHINAEQPNISTIALGWNVESWSMTSVN